MPSTANKFYSLTVYHLKLQIIKDRIEHKERKYLVVKVSKKPFLLVKQTIELSFKLPGSYCIFPVSDCSKRYEDSVVHYIPKLIANPRLRLKANYFDKSDIFSFLDLFKKFKLACDTNRVSKSAVI